VHCGRQQAAPPAPATRLNVETQESGLVTSQMEKFGVLLVKARVLVCCRLTFLAGSAGGPLSALLIMVRTIPSTQLAAGRCSNPHEQRDRVCRSQLLKLHLSQTQC
jgi:hypothetical protein